VGAKIIGQRFYIYASKTRMKAFRHKGIEQAAGACCLDALPRGTLARTGWAGSRRAVPSLNN